MTLTAKGVISLSPECNPEFGVAALVSGIEQN